MMDCLEVLRAQIAKQGRRLAAAEEVCKVVENARPKVADPFLQLAINNWRKEKGDG